MFSNTDQPTVISVPISLEKTRKEDIPEQLPIILLHGNVIFPRTVSPVIVGKTKTKALVRSLVKSKGLCVTVPVANEEREDAQEGTGLHRIGCVSKIVKVINLPDGNMTVIFHGVMRAVLEQKVEGEQFLTYRISHPDDIPVANDDVKHIAIISSIREKAVAVYEAMPVLPQDAIMAARGIDDDSTLVYHISSNTEMSFADKLKMISCDSQKERAEFLLHHLLAQLQFMQLKKDIQDKAKATIERQQREFMLQQQLRTIQDELGDNSSSTSSIVESYGLKALGKQWSNEAREIFHRELNKFSRMNPASPELPALQNYLDVMVSLPWGECSKDNMDIRRAERRLNADHFGLEKVKERILEHLAVIKLRGNLKSPIICLYGPPGVGKTSLGRSIAESLGRKYVRVSLGGLHDEAELRGHRRTYVGAMPGRIIQGLVKAGTSNPVFVLDEIDKVSSDYHGDPAAALLEILDPEQNKAFHDNFLDIDYDLSNILFIATANDVAGISGPLRDRMEMIPVDGYLLEEKVEIASRHLVPKQIEAHGIPKGTFSISRKVMAHVVSKYTRESGVRGLDKVLAEMCRKVALKIARGQELNKSLTFADVSELLGVERFQHDVWSDDLMPGVVTGLAWTAVGGEILFVECATSRGKGKVTMTGNLGNVMRESATLALEYVRSNADRFGITGVDFDEENFHIHVPDGSVPKDGPSAGITMVTAIVSALTGRRVRKRLAMTGEITLRGRVTPVGGISEKVLAAKRAGITDIILCEQNKKDISEIKADYLSGLSFHYVSMIHEVVDLALEPVAQ